MQGSYRISKCPAQPDRDEDRSRGERPKMQNLPPTHPPNPSGHVSTDHHLPALHEQGALDLRLRVGISGYSYLKLSESVLQRGCQGREPLGSAGAFGCSGHCQSRLGAVVSGFAVG